MRARRGLAFFPLLLAASVGASPPQLFTSRVPYAPLLDKLKAAGGDPGKAWVIHGSEDLAAVKPSRRYKYVVRRDGLMVVAPRPADEASNEYVHPILARGEAVRTAGYVHVEHRGAQAEDELVFVDQDSKAYCTTWASLNEARAALARINLGRDRVRFEDHPPTCAPVPGDGGTPPDAGAAQRD